MCKILKNTVCIVLCFLMCVSVTAFAEINRTDFRTPVSMSGARSQKVLGNSAGHKPTHLTDKTGYLTQYFNIPEDVGVLDAVKVCIHGQGPADTKTITLRVYKWDTDEATTLKSEPIAETVLDGYTNNGIYEIYVEDDYNGPLLFWAGNSIGSGGLWNTEGMFNYDAKLRVDGVEMEGRLLESTVYTRKPIEIPEEEGTRDAYALHSAVDFSVNKLDFFERDMGTGEKIPMLDSNEAGKWVCYKNVDFGDVSPKSLALGVYNRACAENSVEIQLVLDDAKKGPIAGTTMTYYYKNEEFKETLNMRLNQEITGVHDIYLTFNRGGISLLDWQFSREALPYTSLDKLQAEFKPVPDSEIIDDYADTWVTSDMVGRKLPSIDKVGPVKEEEKYVAMFYWAWHARYSMLSARDAVLNVQNVLDLYEGDFEDIRFNDSYEGWKGSRAVFWNESIYGFFAGLDDWVVRKEMELLAAADVDLLVLDSPGNTYSGGYLNVCENMHEMRKDGIEPPKLALRTGWGPNGNDTELIERHYHEFIEPGLYSDCWFYYEGKPFTASYPESLDFKTGDPERDAYRQEIKENMTFRTMQASYFTGPTRDDQWPWLEVYPQHPFGKTETGGVECVGVGIAQNTAPGFTTYTAFNQPDCFGRSYTYKDKFSKLSEDSDYYGYNFQEQWDRAFELDPRFVFVTGWNELGTGRFPSYGNNGVNTITNGFGDTFCDEYSRDIIPVKGDFKDTYYLQLVSNIRKFKGVRPTPVANEQKTVALGDFAAWESVEPTFYGYKGGTEPRDEYNYFGRRKYQNYTGRNDIVKAKVTRDDKNIYFYVETLDNLTPYTDDAWMRLFLNTDRVYYTGWEGYDFVINRVSPTENKVTVERNIGVDNIWKWEKAGEGEYTVSGNKMMLTVPRSVLGLEGKALDFEFKWNDNMQQDGYLMDFYVNGDTAPVGRFNYHYIEEASQDKTPENEFIVPYKQLHDMVKYDIVMAINEPKGFLSGDVEYIDPKNHAVTPIIVNDKTMVPIRYIVEAIDATVEWNDETSTAVISHGNNKISIKEGESQLKVNKRPRSLQSPAITVNDRLYVPLRDIVESLELECYWHDAGIIIIGETAYRTATETTMSFLLDFYQNINLKK